MDGDTQRLPHETMLLLAAEGSLFQSGAKQQAQFDKLRQLARLPLSRGCDPAWLMLHGAVMAYIGVMALPNHPLKGEVVRLLKATLELVHKVPMQRQWQPKYTGGALRHFEREVGR